MRDKIPTKLAAGNPEMEQHNELVKLISQVEFKIRRRIRKDEFNIDTADEINQGLRAILGGLKDILYDLENPEGEDEPAVIPERIIPPRTPMKLEVTQTTLADFCGVAVSSADVDPLQTVSCGNRLPCAIHTTSCEIASIMHTDDLE